MADVVGETACFGDTWFFNFDDIRRDIDGSWPENEIMDWSEYVLEYCEGDNKDYYINYWNWLRGARYEKPIKREI